MLNERLVNMPVQVVPPMFRMLEEELQWAIDDVRDEFLIGQERAPLTDFTFAVLVFPERTLSLFRLTLPLSCLPLLDGFVR